MNTHQSDNPLNWVTRFSHLFKTTGTVLDLACGGGRHANYLANMGNKVTGVDKDLSKFLKSEDAALYELIESDLEDGSPWSLHNRLFNGVVVTNYLHRPLFPKILDSIDDNGILIYETFSAGNEQYGRPSNPKFLLTPGELLSICAGRLRVIAYEEGIEKYPEQAVKQRICAIKSPQDDAPLII